MSYDPKENIYRFIRVHIMGGGEVAAVFKNPVGKEEAADERYLVRWLDLEQQHNERMPPDLKFGSAVQMRELVNALSAVQKRKVANGIPLDTPYRETTDSVEANVITLPQPLF